MRVPRRPGHVNHCEPSTRAVPPSAPGRANDLVHATARPACASLGSQRNGEERRRMTERMCEANGVELCTEPFGDPAHSAILLIMGLGASMLWWEENFCQLLVDGGRF